MKPATIERLTRAFYRLQKRMSADGRFVPIEDLVGVSGALFRTYWRAWEPDSAAVCSGAPLRRSAHAHGFDLSPEDPFAEGNGFYPIESRGPMTLTDRIVLFKASIEEGVRLANEDEYEDGGVYTSGFAAYRALVADIAAVQRTTALPEVWLSLHALFESISIARRMSALYLNHLANFIGVASAITPFRRESQALAEASHIVATISAGHDMDERSVVIPVLEAEAAYHEAIAALADARESV